MSLPCPEEVWIQRERRTRGERLRRRGCMVCDEGLLGHQLMSTLISYGICKEATGHFSDDRIKSRKDKL